jgi:LPXTG-motif cell wall-anchored protein
MAGAVTLGMTLPAAADPTCYTACGPGPATILGAAPAVAPSGPTGPIPTQSVPTPGGLPVTGADIEQTAGIAIVLLVAGAGMVRVNRRRAASAR